MKGGPSKKYTVTIVIGVVLLVIFSAMVALFLYTSRQQAIISDNQRSFARMYLNWTLLNEELYITAFSTSNSYQLIAGMSTFESSIQELFVAPRVNTLKSLQDNFADGFSALYIKWPYLKKNFNSMISELSFTQKPELVHDFLTSPLVKSFEQDLIELDREIYEYSRTRVLRFQQVNNLIVVFLLLLLFGLLLFFNSMQQRQKESARVRKLTQSLLRVQEEEKKHIAYNLHDDIIQDMVSLKMQLDTFTESANKSANQSAVIPFDKIKSISAGMQDLIQTTRRFSGSIRPYNLDHLGLIGAIRTICNELVSQTGIQIQFFPVGMDKIKMDYTTRINLYRITQEALRNVIKHSGATRAEVRLISSSPHIILRIKDNGRGFKPALVRSRACGSTNHLGLTSIEERTRLLKGRLDIFTGEGEGTEIKVKVPSRHQ